MALKGLRNFKYETELQNGLCEPDELDYFFPKVSLDYQGLDKHGFAIDF